MTDRIFLNIAEGVKLAFHDKQKIKGKHPDDVANFIDDMTQLYQKYYDKGLSARGASEILLLLSLSGVIYNEPHKAVEEFGEHVRKYGGDLVKLEEQRSKSKG